MGKTYLDTVKYNIVVEFEIKGIVDKPDIIGAVFGQSEGLLGEELDLRELQKNGRIGRIEILQTVSQGKTNGTLTIPSSMDMVETSILAAAVESVDKVGPFESKFMTKNIEDTRNQKRKEIEDRAKLLLKKMMTEQIPDSQELTEKIREDTRSADIEEIGPEKIPCGPGIMNEPSIIVVEGRADVLNLLRNGIKNVIAMGGAKPTQSLINICKQKEVLLFVDGDRGGDLNVRKMMDLTHIDFVAKAPEGKEVEELARKEIIMALRKKMNAEEFLKGKLETPTFNNPNHANNFHPGGMRFERKPMGGMRERMPLGNRPMRPGIGRARPPMGEERMGGNRMENPMDRFERKPFAPRAFSPMERPERFDNSASEAFAKPDSPTPRSIDDLPFTRPQVQQQAIVAEKATAEEEAVFKPIMQALKGSLKAKFLDENHKEIKTIEVREMLKALEASKNAKTIIFDGIITKRVVEEAKQKGVKTIIGVKKGKIENEKEIKLLTMAV
ncbi:MAG: DNA primase DnaG [Candidatus Diapherotrites archaeon]|nr:DNA primase DnaG [Candidatus Diapherotrites archaeon]